MVLSGHTRGAHCWKATVHEERRTEKGIAAAGSYLGSDLDGGVYGLGQCAIFAVSVLQGMIIMSANWYPIKNHNVSVEVTPEMIEAGRRALSVAYLPDGEIIEMYLEMQRAFFEHKPGYGIGGQSWN